MRLTNRFACGLKLAMLPRYMKVGVFHLIVSATRSSASRMASRTASMSPFCGCSVSANQRSTSAAFVNAMLPRILTIEMVPRRVEPSR